MFGYENSDWSDMSRTADWCEFVVVSRRRDLSKAQLSTVLGEYLSSDPDDDYIDNIWRTLSRRQQLYGDVPPFIVVNDRVEPFASLDDHPAYFACLIFALEGNATTQAGSSAAAGALFEHICCTALRRYLSGNAQRFATLRPASVKSMAATIGETFGMEFPPHRNDRGLDVFAWKPWPDNRLGQIVILMQCAAGFNWREKTADLNLAAWRRYIQFSVDPLRAFSLPAVVEDSELSELLMDAGIVLDRPRIYRTLLDGSNDLDRDVRESLVQWCESRLIEMIGS